MISIVIICRDEAAYIEGCLDSIAASAAGEYEVIVVDGGSRDGTPAICRGYAGIPLRVVECTPAGYARQRNAGVRAARFEWIAFVSADVRVTPEWFRELAEATGADADVLIGAFDLVPDGARGAWMAPLARTIYPSVRGDAVERCSTVNLIARRAVLLAHPFDEEVDACEDKDFAFRSGARVFARLQGARPRHLARETFAQWLRKLYREARALARLARRREAFPDCFGWRAHARRALLVMLAGTLLGVPGLAFAAASVHWTGVRRMRLRLVLPHAVAMWTITAGVLAGSLGGRP